MSKNLARMAGFIGASAIAVGFGIMAADAAFADPAGCRGHYPSFTIDNIGDMVAIGTAKCAGSATRTWRVEIKQAIDFQPDPLVAATSETEATPEYAVQTESCDNGHKANYYGRDFFTTNKTTRDSGTWNNVRVC